MESQTPKTSSIDTDLALDLARAVRQHSDQSVFADLTVEVEGALFNTQRFLLSAYSGFFHGLVTSEMREASERHVSLKNVSKETFELILEYICKCTNVLNESNFIDLWHAADMLQILPLKNVCETFIKSNTNVENCLQIYSNAKLLDVKSIIELSWDFIMSHFVELKGATELLDFSLKDIKTLIESEKLATKSEDQVIELILKWTTHVPVNSQESDEFLTSVAGEKSIPGDISCVVEQSSTIQPEPTERVEAAANSLGDQAGQPDVQNQTGAVTDEKASLTSTRLAYPRAQFLHELLVACRLRLVSNKCLMQLLAPSCLIQQDQKVKALVMKCIQWKLEGGSESSNACSIWSLQRLQSDYEDVVVWFDCKSKHLRLIKLRGESKLLTICSCQYEIHAATILDNRMFVILNEGLFTMSISAKPVFTVIITEIADSPDVSMIVIDNQLHVVGTNVPESKVVFSGVSRIIMTALKDLPIQVRNITLAAVGQNIVIFGKQENREGVTIVQCIDTHNNVKYSIDVVEGSPTRLATFQSYEETFFLFPTGALWKLEHDHETGRLRARKIKLLWDYDRALCGAKIIKGELWVFDGGPPTTLPTWSTPVEGAFEKIRNVSVPAKGRHFLNISLPKSML